MQADVGIFFRREVQDLHRRRDFFDTVKRLPVSAGFDSLARTKVRIAFRSTSNPKRHHWLSTHAM